MPEGFDPAEAPVRRGRKDPQLALALEADNHLDDAGDTSEQSYIGLLPGDIVAAKVTHTFTRDDGQDSWFSYGVQSRVMQGETEEDTFVRVASIANERVLDLADDAENRIQLLAQAQQQQRRR